MNNETRVCPDCDAAEYGNLFCNTCIEEFEKAMGKSEFTSTLKKINLQRKKPNKTNKPDWEDAPEWAEWLAMDESGEWWWFENEPYTERIGFDGCWNSRNGKLMECEIPFNWETTREKKP